MRRGDSVVVKGCVSGSVDVRIDGCSCSIMKMLWQLRERRVRQSGITVDA